MRIPVTLFTDPGCPFGYSAMPSLARLRWRFGDQLEWRLVMIGLTEEPAEYEERGETALSIAQSWRRLRRHGMPFAVAPKERVAATSRACRAVVATRLEHPGREWAALVALQRLQFTSRELLDDDVALQRALARVDGIDAARVVDLLDDPAIRDAYEADRALARTAMGTAAAAQGRTAGGDPGDPERFTAPTVVVDDRWVAGGFHPYATYDALIANVDPSLERRPAPEDPVEALAEFPDGLATAEVSAVMTPGVEDADPGRAEAALIDAFATGAIERRPVADGALWRASRTPADAGEGVAGGARNVEFVTSRGLRGT